MLLNSYFIAKHGFNTPPLAATRDALSLVVLLDKEYGLKVVDPDQGKAVLYSIQTIADHIQAAAEKA
jgi:hypothetical protein